MPLVSRRKVSDAAEIPTASMADIAFLLIIFFMVTTIFSKEKGLKLVLPEKREEEIKIKPENLLKISINPSGDIYMGDDKVTLEEVGPQTKKRVEENDKLIVLLRTHERAPYQRMVDVFDELRAIDVKKLSIGSIKDVSAR